MKLHDFHLKAGRCFVIAIGTATTAMVGAHSLAAVLRHFGPSDAPVAAEPLNPGEGVPGGPSHSARARKAHAGSTFDGTVGRGAAFAFDESWTAAAWARWPW